jgi:uncharacterized membrane protein YccC
MLNTIIERTEKIAIAYLTGLGFGEEQVAPLMQQARKDLETEFARLEALRHAPQPDAEQLDRSLHAIKGLLFNLGNHDLAERLEALRHEGELNRMLADLDRVLREAAQ